MFTVSPFMRMTVSYFSMAISVVLMLTVARDAHMVHKRKTIGALNPVPYMAMFARSSTYIVYCYVFGLYSVMGLSVYVSSLAFMASCVFFKYTAQEERSGFLRKAALVVLPFLLASAAVVLFLPSEYHVSAMDVIAIISSCGPYFFPLRQVIKITRAKAGGEALSPMFLTLVFIEAIAWTIYGYLLESLPLWGPCAAGIFITLLSLYAALKYRAPKAHVSPKYLVAAPSLPEAFKAAPLAVSHNSMKVGGKPCEQEKEMILISHIALPASPPHSPPVSPPCSHGRDDLSDMV